MIENSLLHQIAKSYGESVLETFSLAMMRFPDGEEIYVGKKVNVVDKDDKIIKSGRVLKVIMEGLPYAIVALEAAPISASITINVEINLSELIAQLGSKI